MVLPIGGRVGRCLSFKPHSSKRMRFFVFWAVALFLVLPLVTAQSDYFEKPENLFNEVNSYEGLMLKCPAIVNVDNITTGIGLKRIKLLKNVIPSILGIRRSRITNIGTSILHISNPSLPLSATRIS